MLATLSGRSTWQDWPEHVQGGGPGAAERKQLSCRAQAVAGDFFAALGGSFTLGSAPAFNLARCLQDPTLAAFSSA